MVGGACWGNGSVRRRNNMGTGLGIITRDRVETEWLARWIRIWPDSKLFVCQDADP
jgi:hypothetical protein